MTKAEFCGLTLDDIDIKNKQIRIDHQLQRTREGVYMQLTHTKNRLPCIINVNLSYLAHKEFSPICPLLYYWYTTKSYCKLPNIVLL